MVQFDNVILICQIHVCHKNLIHFVNSSTMQVFTYINGKINNLLKEHKSIKSGHNEELMNYLIYELIEEAKLLYLMPCPS